MCLELQKKSTPSVATPVAKTEFKKGDKVYVTRKVASHTEGWNNSWVTAMDEAVGKIGTVMAVYGTSGIQLNFPGTSIGIWSYPSHVLEPLKTPAPATTTPSTPVNDTLVNKVFYVGQRVNVNYPFAPGWNGLAVVVEIYSGGDISVRPETGIHKGSRGAFDPKYLTSVSSTTEPISAKQLAVTLALKNGYPFETNADEVQAELKKLGLPTLGSAAGTLFKTNFQNTGKTVQSTREGNRGRRIIVWRYVGALTPGQVTAPASPQPATTAPQTEQAAEPQTYIIKFHRIGDAEWHRSGNVGTKGVFADIAKATEAAQAEQNRNGMVYQVFPSNLPATVGTATSKYVVQYRYNKGNWGRSSNPGASGVFTTLAEAEKAAASEQKAMGPNYEYKAVPLT